MPKLHNLNNLLKVDPYSKDYVVFTEEQKLAVSELCRLLTSLCQWWHQHLTIKCPHAVHTLLTMDQAAQVTAARWNKWSTVLEAPNIIIRGHTCNPATLVLPPDTTLLEHDCCELVLDQLLMGLLKLLGDGAVFSCPDEMHAQIQLPATHPQKIRYAYY